MATFNKIYQFTEDLAKAVHNLATNSLKVLLTATAPVATNKIKTDLTEIAAGNGYTAGGLAPVITSAVQTTGVFKLVLADITFAAAGGPLPAFRYPTLWNDTPTSPLDPLIGWYDYGSAIVLADAETFIVDFDGSNGVFTVT